MFLCETKNITTNVTTQCNKAGFQQAYCVDPRGQSGGLVLAWKNNAVVSILSSDDFFIFFEWTDPTKQRKWEVVAVHLHCDDNIRFNQFRRIMEIKMTASPYFLVIGDFNAISAYHEKEGGRMKSASSIEVFNKFISDGELVDLGYEGRKFTWSNRRYGDNLIMERLDRCLSTHHFRANYSQATILHLDDTGSDHCPLMLLADREEHKAKRRF
ncbi:uncharacterized protein LOC107615206 [Arachis ipaensis]|uniref:uncharacterized protein LOC107615206 n=1 Tax=Arachis ipaensis TaxID=130454 RepID=UPI0007AF6E06|nr:uncharacterized protein LOC107615206 [Arachis ipaensis]XP_025678268.1 uncharacterized protein LOC112778120 [Arachis hypogaea]